MAEVVDLKQTGPTLRDTMRQRFGHIVQAIALRVDSISNPFTGLGNPNVDKGAASIPTGVLPLTIDQCRALYRCNGIAKRWVDVLADKGTRAGWRVDVPDQEATDDPDPDLDPMATVDADLGVWAKVADAWRWARRDGGSYILMVTDEGQDVEVLAKPLEPGANVVALQVFTLEELTPSEWDDDLAAETYRNPSAYYFTPRVGGTHATVHASRVLAFDGTKIDAYEKHVNNGTADSILQSSWDQIRNLTTIGQAGANLAQELQLHILKVKMPDEIEAHDELGYFEARTRLIAKSKSSVGLLVLGEDEEYETMSANISGFKEFGQAAKDEIAAITGLPQTEIFGESPGGMNSDGASQRMTTNDLIALTQDKFIKTPLTKLYGVVFAAKDGPTNGVVPDRWKIEFHPAKKSTATEQATLEETHAKTDAVRIASGVVLPEHVTESRFGPAGYQNQLGAVKTDDMVDGTFEEMERLRGEEAPEPEEATDEPSTEPAGEGETPDAPTATAYNGAQMQGAINIVKDVTSGALSLEGATAMLQTLLNLTPDAAAAFLAGAEEAETPAPAGPVPAVFRPTDDEEPAEEEEPAEDTDTDGDE